jgi:general secretion pathway protein D
MRVMKIPLIILYAFMAVALTACNTVSFKPSDQHIQETPKPVGQPPKVLQTIPLPEKPSAKKQVEVFTVVVNDVPVSELLFAIARDANINIDIASDVTGEVTLNAIDQTFQDILERISNQVEVRYSEVNGIVRVELDAPYIKHYEVSYVNMDRRSEATIAIATEVSSTGGGSGSESTVGNTSNTSITNSSTHQFWTTIVNNVRNIVRQSAVEEEVETVSDALSAVGNLAALSSSADGGADLAQTGDGEAEGEGAESSVARVRNVMSSPESGLITVNATQRQHREVERYLELALEGVQRQVFIEATIVEVELNDDYQAGVDWSRLLTNPAADGFSFTQSLIGNNLLEAPATTLQYVATGDKFNVNATVRLLNQFGNAKILSTPKIMALNNQTALLKVVDNRVYFTINVETETNDNNTIRTFESVIHTLPVGLVMSVTPQISANNEVTLNVRPTISRILRFIPDPNPALGDVESFVPEVSVREIESILRIKSGDVAVIGGLMQDNRSNSTDGVPQVSKLPFVGDLFSYKNNKASKSELVIFLKPIVANKPSLGGEFAQYKRFIEKEESQRLGNAK